MTEITLDRASRDAGRLHHLLSSWLAQTAEHAAPEAVWFGGHAYASWHEAVSRMASDLALRVMPGVALWSSEDKFNYIRNSTISTSEWRSLEENLKKEEKRLSVFLASQPEQDSATSAADGTGAPPKGMRAVGRVDGPSREDVRALFERVARMEPNSAIPGPFIRKELGKKSVRNYLSRWVKRVDVPRNDLLERTPTKGSRGLWFTRESVLRFLVARWLRREVTGAELMTLGALRQDQTWPYN